MPFNRLRMPDVMGANILANSGEILNQSKSKTDLLFTKLLLYIEDRGIGQLAVFRGDLKRLTSLTPIPNIALKTVNFYSA